MPQIATRLRVFAKSRASPPGGLPDRAERRRLERSRPSLKQRRGPPGSSPARTTSEGVCETRRSIVAPGRFAEALRSPPDYTIDEDPGCATARAVRERMARCWPRSIDDNRINLLGGRRNAPTPTFPCERARGWTARGPPATSTRRCSRCPEVRSPSSAPWVLQQGQARYIDPPFDTGADFSSRRPASRHRSCSPSQTTFAAVSRSSGSKARSRGPPRARRSRVLLAMTPTSRIALAHGKHELERVCTVEHVHDRPAAGAWKAWPARLEADVAVVEIRQGLP